MYEGITEPPGKNAVRKDLVAYENARSGKVFISPGPEWLAGGRDIYQPGLLAHREERRAPARVGGEAEDEHRRERRDLGQHPLHPLVECLLPGVPVGDQRLDVEH